MRSLAVDSTIRHVTDTALWVASVRAQEGQRKAPAFIDPVAALLSGERGRAIARSMPRAALTAWGVIMRTTAIDRLIDAALAAGVDTVLNLGAGLDGRPYRMQLPASLRWVELDFPAIIDLKNAVLVDRPPVCNLEYVAIDLRDRSGRNEILARHAAASQCVLVITEGVLPYFAARDVAALADDLHAHSSIRFWIQDFDNAGRRGLPSEWESKLKAAPLLLDVDDWFEFFERHGWRSFHAITSFEESRRLSRPYPLDFPRGLVLRVLPAAMSRRILCASGAVLMQRAASHIERV